MTRCPSCQRAVGDDGTCPDCGRTVTDDQYARGNAVIAASPETRVDGTSERADTRHRQTAHHTRSDSRQSGRRRPPLPTGLKAVCAFLVLSGVGSLWVGNVTRDMSAKAARYGASQGTTLETVGLVVMVLGVGQVVAAVGLWTRNSWGWTAAMVVTGTGALSGLWLLTNSYTSTLGLIVLLFNAVVGWYVYSQRWRYRHGRQPRRQPAQSRTRQDHDGENERG